MRRLASIVMVIPLVLAVAAPASAAPVRDRRPPTVRFTTTDDDVIVAAPVDADLTRVRGTTADRYGRGVKMVSVVFCANARRYPAGGWSCGGTGVSLASPMTRRTADVTCSDSSRRICRWSVSAPTIPGNYLVIATATDRAGNRRTVGPIFITVV